MFGFHATKAETAKALVETSGSAFKPSANNYDWLGHGMYFWENSPHRAERFARDRRIPNAVVIGAVLDLGHCLDLTDSESLSYLSTAYHALKATLEAAGEPLPNNTSPKFCCSHDLLIRELDCAVINFLHAQRRRDMKKSSKLTILCAVSSGKVRICILALASRKRITFSSASATRIASRGSSILGSKCLGKGACK